MKYGKTIVIVGGGYAGINLIKGLRKVFSSDKDLNIILVDKHNYHFKKVKLFKAIVEDGDEIVKVPFTKYAGIDFTFIQGELTGIHQQNQTILVRNEFNQDTEINYDKLVLALGSAILEKNAKSGGTSLSNLAAAKKIRKELLSMIYSGKSGVRIGITGGGITGIETSAELAVWLKNEANLAGMEPTGVEIILINQNKRLLEGIPEKVSNQLTGKIESLGVKILHNSRALTYDSSKLYFEDGGALELDYCIWTLGVKPHPSLQSLGIPLLENGKLKADLYYRLHDAKNIYTIGDCALVKSSKGEVSGMTCKEAINQANRLSKIIKSDLYGGKLIGHETFPNSFCISLGPKNGFVWAHKWGIDFVLTGKLGAQIREYTWNVASLID